jgi:hypothetical protein
MVTLLFLTTSFIREAQSSGVVVLVTLVFQIVVEIGLEKILTDTLGPVRGNNCVLEIYSEFNQIPSCYGGSIPKKPCEHPFLDIIFDLFNNFVPHQHVVSFDSKNIKEVVPVNLNRLTHIELTFAFQSSLTSTAEYSFTKISIEEYLIEKVKPTIVLSCSRNLFPLTKSPVSLNTILLSKKMLTNLIRKYFDKFPIESETNENWNRKGDFFILTIEGSIFDCPPMDDNCYSEFIKLTSVKKGIRQSFYWPKGDFPLDSYTCDKDNYITGLIPTTFNFKDE